MTPRFLMLAAAGVIAASRPALAQARYPDSSPRSVVAPRLPVPPVSPDAGPQPFLTTARDAVLAGRTGAAEEALERAETRLLNRSATQAAATSPDLDRAVLDVGAARHSLVVRDRPATLRAIDDALEALQAEPASTYAAQPSSPPAPPTDRALPFAAQVPPPGAPVSLAPPGVVAISPPPPPSEATVVPAAPPQPSVTYALLPGHWQLNGARYVWIPPETRLRRVVDRPLVPGVNVWKGGRWVFVRQHYGAAGGS